MTAKITLYSEYELIKEIKKFAKDKNTSVSKLVNGFFSKDLLWNRIQKELSQPIKDTKVQDKRWAKKYWITIK